MSSSREEIFRRLRSALPESSPLPVLPATGPWQTFDNPLDQFTQMLESVGGRCVHATSLAAADRQLCQLDAWNDAAVRVSLVDAVGDSTLDLQSVDDPHDLEHVGFAVLHGQFGVAENGAVWVTDEGVKHRVLYFIPQHVALVIPSSAIVNNMHEAYARLDVVQNTFGGFISGPSKTADIEQSLVIGAHGARSLTVFAVDETPYE